MARRRNLTPTIHPTEHPRYDWLVKFVDSAGKSKKRYFKARADAEALVSELMVDGIDTAPIGADDRAILREFAPRIAEAGVSLRAVLDRGLANLERIAATMDVEQAVSTYLAKKEAESKSDSHIALIRCRVNTFAEEFAGKNLAEISAEDVNAWLAVLARDRELAPLTVRSWVSYIASFLRHGGQHDTANGLLKPTHEFTREVELYSPKEARKWIEAAGATDSQWRDNLAACVAIGYFAGLRTTEIQRLKWEHFDNPDPGFIDVQTVKTRGGRSRYVPINAQLRAWLEAYPNPKSVWVWPHSGASVRRGELLLKDAREAAKIPLRHNGLRHAYGSFRLVQLKGARETLADEMGNSPNVIDSHYRRKLTPAKLRAWETCLPLG